MSHQDVTGQFMRLGPLSTEPVPVSAYVTASHLHCTAGSLRSFTAIRKDAGLYCGPRLRKGEVFAYVELPQHLKDLKDAGLYFGSRLRKGEVFAYVGLPHKGPKGATESKSFLRKGVSLGRVGRN